MVNQVSEIINKRKKLKNCIRQGIYLDNWGKNLLFAPFTKKVIKNSKQLKTSVIISNM